VIPTREPHLVPTPSAVDQRRLRDGARALELSSCAPSSRDEIRRQMADISDGIVALQSLDNLGPEANARAERDQQELWTRFLVLKKKLKKKLEGENVP